MLEFMLFWAWFAIPVVLLFLAVSGKSIAWAILVSLLTIGVWWLGGILALPWVWANIGTLLIGAGVYLLIGSFIGGFDFWLECKDALTDFKKNKEAQARKEWTEKQSSDSWRGKTYLEYTKYFYNVPLYASENKEKISIWVFFWPIKAVTTLLGDYIWRAAKAIVIWVSGLYQRISDHVFRDLTP